MNGFNRLGSADAEGPKSRGDGLSPQPVTLGNRFMRGLSRRTPALAKVLLSEFGAASLARSAASLLALVAFALLSGVILPRLVAPGIAVPVVLLELVIIFRLKGLDTVGQLLCARGVVEENLSHLPESRNYFLAAVELLRSRLRAYQGLYRIAETKAAMRDLARLIQRKERVPSGTPALLAARCLREADEPQSARRSFELADKLESADPVKLELAEICLVTGSPRRCLEALDGMAQPDPNGQCFFFRAKALRLLGRLDEALRAANRAAQARPCDPDCQVEKGRILEELERHRGAARQYTKAIRVHERHPEALFRRALLNLRRGLRAAARRDLEQCYSYQNTWTEAYLLARAPENSIARCPEALKSREVGHWLKVETVEFHLVKGDYAPVEVIVRLERAASNCRVTALEPFGGGLEVKPREVTLDQVEAGRDYRLVFRVKAKRADAVNLNQPWVVNFVLTAGENWASRSACFRVQDPIAGKAFWVLTNDHEPRPHIANVLADGRAMMQTGMFERDLIRSSELANLLAERYGLKWSHLLDAGGAVSLLGWAGGHDRAWEQLRDKAQAHYHQSLSRGHDFQLHLHLCAVPESDFFCYGYDRKVGGLYFNLLRRRSNPPDSRVKSWANVTASYGKDTNVRSRCGSLARAKQLVGGVLSDVVPGYHPIFFRAGQWDLGASVAEREKSILAMRESGILADSSVTEGYNCYKKPFRFGAPPSRAAYFTCRNNPEKRARALVDVGMLEVVPITLPQGRHPVTPRDDPGVVIGAYRGVQEEGRIKPGRHVIMEIEHLATVGDGNRNGAREESNADWRSMERHFAAVRKACPNLEGTGATEAVYSWLDYYSPELIVRLAPHQISPNTLQGGQPRLVFPLRFLGDGILTEEERPYRLAVLLPSMATGQVRSIRILESGKVAVEKPKRTRDRLMVELLLSERNQHEFALEVESA